MAMPGVGWTVGVLTLITASLLVPFIGRKYVITVFIVNSIHLFTLGPLSRLGQSGPVQPSPIFLAIFVFVPAAIALVSILLPEWRVMTKHKSESD